MAIKRLLGINFDLEALDIVEIERQKIVAYHHVPYLETEDKAEVKEVADEIKLAAVLQKNIRDKKIETTEVIATIPSKEVLLRSFFIPFLPKSELRTAVDFEVRKFVPIKLDELYFDYLIQRAKERGVKKLKTHFIGIKKEILNKFIYALEQSNLKVLSIETAPFSLLRVLLYKKLTKANSNIAIVEASQQEGSICIIEGGFPQLIRDFKFTALSKDIYSKEPDTLSYNLNKEIRLSLDYYRRQSSKANVGRVFLFTDLQDSQLKDEIIKELNIPVSCFSAKEILNLKEDFSIGLLKAYGIAIRNIISSPITIDLYRKGKVVEVKEKAEAETEIEEAPVSLKSIVRTAIIAGLFVLLFYLFVDFNQVVSLKSKLNSLTKKRLSLKQKLSSFNLAELENLKSNYEEKIQALQDAKQTTYVTPLLNALPSLITEGVWLNKIDFSLEPKPKFTLEAKAYLAEESKQIYSVNKFFSNIKENQEFQTLFSSINLDFIKQRIIDDFVVTEFGITCSQ